MSYLRNFMVGLVIVLSITGCEYETANKEVKINDEYVLSLPSYLSETDRLAPEALIQYQNKFRSFYLICDGEKKVGDNDLELFTEEVIKGFTGQITGINVKKIENKTEVNGLPAQYHELTGTISNKGIYYLLVTLESPSHFYQICSWTLLSKKEQHEQAFHEIVSSFKKI